MKETRKYTIDAADGSGIATGELVISSHVVRGETFFFVSFDHEYWTGGDFHQVRHQKLIQGGTFRDARAYAEGWLSSWGEVTIFPAK